MDKADKIREFKELLDEGIINQEEFEKEKKKLLNFLQSLFHTYIIIESLPREIL